MAETVSPELIRVDIDQNDDGSFSVTPVFSGVDHPNGTGYRLRHRKLAERLAAAMYAGAVFGPVTAKVNIYGKTYASYSEKVLARTMNADLKRLGY